MPSAFTSFQGQQNAQFHLSHFKFEAFEASLRALHARTSEKLEDSGVASHGDLVGPPLIKRQREDSAKLVEVMNDFKDASKKSYGEQIANLTWRGDILNRTFPALTCSVDVIGCVANDRIEAGEQICEKLTRIEKRKTKLKTLETKAAEVRERQALFDARRGELEKTQAEVRDLQARRQAESESVQRLQGEMGAERKMASELQSQLEAKLESKKERTSQLYSQLEDGRNQLWQLQAELGAERERRPPSFIPNWTRRNIGYLSPFPS